MRRTLTPVLLGTLMLGSLALSAPLREISRSRYVGVVRGAAMLPVNGEHVLAVVSERDGTRSHLRLHNPGLESLYQERMRGRPVGIVEHGGAVWVSNYHNGTLETLGFRARSDKIEKLRIPDCNIGALRNPRGLSFTSTTAGPVLVLGYDGGIAIVTLRSRGAASVLTLARPGKRYVAATKPFRFDRDGNADILAVEQRGNVIRIEQNGTTWQVAREMRLTLPGFVPTSIVGRRGEFWLGGRAGARGQVHRFGWKSRRVHRVGPIEIEDKSRSQRPKESHNTGPGTVETLSWCGRDLLAVGGSKGGRAWGGLLQTSGTARFESEVWFRGAKCTFLYGNSHRRGWTLYSALENKQIAMARLDGDREYPRKWNPFRPKPAPAPVPTPGPDVIPGDTTDPGTDVGNPGVPAANRNVAVLPVVSIDNRRSMDTELVLVQMNRSVRVTLRVISDAGRVLHTRTITLRKDRRIRVSIAAELRQLGVPSFEGYLRIDGGRRADLIVDAVRRVAGRGENLRVYWR